MLYVPRRLLRFPPGAKQQLLSMDRLQFAKAAIQTHTVRMSALCVNLKSAFHESDFDCSNLN